MSNRDKLRKASKGRPLQGDVVEDPAYVDNIITQVWIKSQVHRNNPRAFHRAILDIDIDGSRIRTNTLRDAMRKHGYEIKFETSRHGKVVTRPENIRRFFRGSQPEQQEAKEAKEVKEMKETKEEPSVTDTPEQPRTTEEIDIGQPATDEIKRDEYILSGQEPQTNAPEQLSDEPDAATVPTNLQMVDYPDVYTDVHPGDELDEKHLDSNELKVRYEPEGKFPENPALTGGSGDLLREPDVRYGDVDIEQYDTQPQATNEGWIDIRGTSIESEEEQPYGMYQTLIDSLEEQKHSATSQEYSELMDQIAAIRRVFNLERSYENTEDQLRTSMIPRAERRYGSQIAQDVPGLHNWEGRYDGSAGDGPEDIGLDDFLRAGILGADEGKYARTIDLSSVSDDWSDVVNIGLETSENIRDIQRQRRARAAGESSKAPRLPDNVARAVATAKASADPEPYRTSTGAIRKSTEGQTRRGSRYTNVGLVRKSRLNHLRSITELMPTI